MDSMITAAAHALASGDPLGALKRIALRKDAAALAMRGTAMAQLGDFARAKILLRSAARAFGPKEPFARARCVIAEAEVALAARELEWSVKALDAARKTLDRHGDPVNVVHALHIQARRYLLLGNLGDAEKILSRIDTASLIPAMRAVHELTVGGIAMRRLQAKATRAALLRAAEAAREAGIPALINEVEVAANALHTPAARLLAGGNERILMLEEVESLFTSEALVADACRNRVCHQGSTISLASRPVLFALLRRLAEAFPEDVSRQDLLLSAFGARSADESHRGRLRVEVGRLRRLVRPFADIRATKAGFILVPKNEGAVCVLAPPVEEPHAATLAILADGEAWSSSALAYAMGTSQRSTQRALESLRETGKVQSLGAGRARRWVLPPIPGFTTTSLLTSLLVGE